MSSKQAIATDDAPKAAGAYSQAIKANGFVFLSGQVPIDPATGRLIEDADIGAHVRRVMDNLGAVLKAAGSSFDQVVKATVYLGDIQDFLPANKVYAEYFTGDAPPARAAFQAGVLPLNARVEIEMIALAD